MSDGCPFHSDGAEETAESDDSREGAVDRREFVKSALLIGGAGAVGSLGSVAGITTSARAAPEPITAAARLNRQHAWDAYEPTAASGNTPPPPNSVLLMLDYQGVGEPAPGPRRQVEAALRSIERHFDWHHDGVLFTMAYSASYFDRYDEDPPAGAAPDPAEEVVGTVEELTDVAATNDDVAPDDYDAALLLTSRNEANVLAAEAALWGEDTGHEFDATFEGVFERPEGWPARRVGFAGPEFQAREEEYEERFAGEVPDEAPLSMGFVAGFGESIPREEAVTLVEGQRFPGPSVERAAVPTDLPYVGSVGERDPGVFAQGTLKHVSHLELGLEDWYGAEGGRDESGDDRRRHQMYSPYHDEAETNAEGGDKPGSGLTEPDPEAPNEVGPDDDRFDVREYADRVPETARGDDTAETAEPTVGHSQKTARARYDVDGDGDPEQPVLRRDWDSITPTDRDGDAAGYIFNVPMRFNESIYTLLDATYNVGFTSLDGAIDHEPAAHGRIRERNGIAPHMTALRRGNWLVPPITLRALPYPRARRVPPANLSVEREGDRFRVEVGGVGGPGPGFDVSTVRFGTPAEVNRAQGVEPARTEPRYGATLFEFPVEGTALPDAERARLFGKAPDTRKPVVATTPLR